MFIDVWHERACHHSRCTSADIREIIEFRFIGGGTHSHEFELAYIHTTCQYMQSPTWRVTSANIHTMSIHTIARTLIDPPSPLM